MDNLIGNVAVVGVLLLVLKMMFSSMEKRMDRIESEQKK